MKKIITPFLIFLLYLIPAQAQEHLPIINSDEDSTMVAVFRITDGDESISLLETNVGFFLKDWTRSVIQQNVTFRQSPLTPGRRPVSAVYGTTEEVIQLVVNGHGQDGLITETQKLLRLLNKGLDFWITDWQDEVVYLQARAACETNLEYAEILSFRIPELGKSYQQPFYSASELAALDEFRLIIERKHWKANVPGTGACAEVSGVQDWQYEELWQVNTVQPLLQVYSLIQTANGYIYAGDWQQIWRSTDNGATWGVNTAMPAGYVYSLLQTANGYIYAGDLDRILRSIDNGASWQVNSGLPSNYPYSMIQTEPDGYIYAGDGNGRVLRSTDNGANWGINFTMPVAGSNVYALLQTDNGDIYAAGTAGMWRSIDYGENWFFLFTDPFYSLLQTDNGDIYAGGGGEIWKSTNNGESWQIQSTPSVLQTWTMIQAFNGDIYAGAGTLIIRSIDSGVSWQTEVLPTTTQIERLLQTTNGYIYAGTYGKILWARASLNSMGHSATCLDEVYVSNKQSIGNLTHIKIDDGGVFTDIFPIVAFPQTLLPAVPAINDAIYFGQETSVDNAGPFSNLVYDIETPIFPAATYTILYEYWNGAWNTLTVQDNTANTAGAFRISGVNSVHWEQPSDWATTAIDGETGYWVRARVSALGGAISPPTQQNRDIYSIVLPYVNIADTVVGGDIPALLQAKLTNQSDADGRGSSGPDLWDNRIVTGLRSYDRGDLFQAYLNISDEQQPVGVTVEATGANTVFGANTQAPTGRRALYTSVGVEAMATQVTIELGPTIARDFYGTFHAYLRARDPLGPSSNFNIQLQITTGSGGITFTSESQQLQTTTAFEVIDFGVITIPPSGSLKSSDLGDITELRIQASAAGGALNLELYDLILIPTDEWAGDFVDFANSTDSIVGRNDNLAKLLDIDSVTDPRKGISSLVRQADTDLITSVYNPISNGEAILQSNASQRLWFFAMRTFSTVLSVWIAPPEIAHSVQLYHNARYLGLRGTD